MYYIASCSFGKDSLAMVLMLIEKHYPLDEVVFYDTGMEFNAIYSVRDRLIPVLRQHGIKYTEFHPDRPFVYDMLYKPVESKQKGMHYGYGWCGGVCRWGTAAKQKALDDYAKQKNALVYIGIAFDEFSRVSKVTNPFKLYPLIDWHMTEKDCLDYCYSLGWNWLENGVELYSILDRVSCWCCCNKNKKELYNIWKFLPEYWYALKFLQSQIDRPMKNYSNKSFGDYGNVFALEEVFRGGYFEQ